MASAVPTSATPSSTAACVVKRLDSLPKYPHHLRRNLFESDPPALPMDAEGHAHDIEAASTPKHRRKSETALLEASALLVVWSLLVINEGTIRFMTTNPTADLLAPGRPPPIVAFLAALFEVVFGIIGLFLGLYGLVLKTHNPRTTKLCMFAQSVLAGTSSLCTYSCCPRLA